MRLSTVRCLLLCLAIVFACSDASKLLPNGYQLVTFNGREAGIVAPNGDLVILPDVGRYAVQGDLVIGYARVPEALEGQSAPLRKEAGYFLLNTKTAEVADVLSEKQWRERLAHIGVLDDPKLDPY